MTDFRAAIRETLEGCIARENDPEYARRAADLRAASESLTLYERQRARREALERAGIPEASWPYLDAPETTPAILAVRVFLAGTLRFLTLGGPGDTGKTVALSFAVAKEGGRYVTAADLVRASTFDKSYWRDLEAARLLAIDELAAEQGNAAYDQNLYELLDLRFRRCRKTVLGTNLGPEDFKARYCVGALSRLYRRLKDHGEFKVVKTRRPA